MLDIIIPRTPMDITFQKRPGDPSLGIQFFWKMEIRTESRFTITDHFIPELYFDYFLIKEGKLTCVDEIRGTRITLPSQALKTIHTRPLTFVFTTPLVLYGARLLLRFAESFWEEMRANCFLSQTWVGKAVSDLEAFQSQAVDYFVHHRTAKSLYPMFSSDLEESAWLVNFSARHKRRLYKTMFGVSRRQMQNIRNMHMFLDQACDFYSEAPRIIRHVNPDVFYDQPHLNHTFQNLTGFSPTEYFQASSVLQDHLMSASYNAFSRREGKL